MLKELLENSIDADATQIDVIIQGGGVQEIIVRDNGCGIVKEDLALALQQHATSKIATAEDLAAIYSLGFRGEALASIAAVARVQLTSHAAAQDHAWTITNDHAEHVIPGSSPGAGSGQAAASPLAVAGISRLTPAAHPLGTTVQVKDLFYNLPARKKFLRSANTEYQHLEEVFRRIALSNFDIAFKLRSNDKLLKNLPICKDQAARLRRVAKLCGQRKDLLYIDADQNGMRLYGWLSPATAARSQEPHQYFFINGRVIRDRLINHAIREVYQPLCAPGTMPFYCLYLELDPVALDVNVHPTKHEVRFRDPRIVHAFLGSVLRDALGAEATAEPQYVPSAYTHNDLKILTTLGNSIVIAQSGDKLLFLNLATAPIKQLSALQTQPYRHLWREVALDL